MIQYSCCIPGGSLMPEGVSEVPDSPAGQIVEKCRFLLSVGYDRTECAGGMLADLTPEDLDYLVEENRKSPLGLIAVNSLFPWGYRLADPYADHTPYYERAVRLFTIMQKLGIPYAVFGSGGARSLRENRIDGYHTLSVFLNEIGRAAADRGVTIVIEPLRHTETDVFVTVPETGEKVRAMDDEHIRLLYDAFHMAEEGTDLSCVREYLDLVKHCHIAESPKRSAPGSDDSADPSYNRRFAAELIKGGYDGAVSVECGFRDFKAEAVSSLTYLREIFAVADTVTCTPARDLCEEPVYCKPEHGTVPAGITSAKADGRLFPASPWKDGALVILTAKKGEKLTLTLGHERVGRIPTVSLGGCHRYGRDIGTIDVRIGDRLFGSYVTYGFDKPFFGPVTDAEGNVFTRVDPDTREHPHQRSVFIGVGDVNGVDCWNETPGHGCVRNQVIKNLKQEAAYASFTVGNIWTDADGKPLVCETSTYTVYNQSDVCRALDVEVTFRADHGDVTFGPTKEAGPLGIRLRDELRADIGAGQLTNSWGGVGEGECWSHAAAWCDYYGEPAGIGPMGVTVFDNEKNERFPTAWHIRAYGLFAANNLYFKGDLTIKNGESLTYRFRILFRRRPMSREEISDRFVHYTLRPID